MIYLKVFPEHISYEDKVNRGGESFKIPNVSYCVDADDIHFNPYNTVEFYVGNITEPQTVKIYTDDSTYIDITVSEGNKWYSYLLPKDNWLYRVEGDSVKKVIVKADIDAYNGYIIPNNTVEASFNGSKATDTSRYIFSGCTSLTSLDLSSFDTSKVNNMGVMFSECTSLTSLDVSSFDTSNATDMRFMFSNCSNLKSLDVSSFDTSKVTDMSGMFNDCTSLTSLDLSSFKTSKVTRMNNMFYGCSKLTSLVLSGWDTYNVTNMSNMFYGCSGLTSLDLSGWNMSNVTSMIGMFDGCASLTSIRMIGCSPDTIQKITDVKPSSATIETRQTI